jgi:NADP-dependent 3-hydroxy acid dehydrogenase YdfG
MNSSKPLMLLLGAGSNISQAVAEKFEAEGYRVAIAARRIEDG